LVLKDRIMGVIEETSRDLGYWIYEASVLVRGEDSRIAVKLDSLAGISHNDCERFSRELSGRLDDKELLPNYSVEVSSPGFNRKLKGLDDFVRFKGAPVKVVYSEGDVNRVFKGTIEDVRDGIIDLRSGEESLSLSIDIIQNSNLDY
jgi:ribosome maturation factor RimP